MARKAGEPIILGNPQRGIAASPHLGIADIRNCDIHSEPGIIKINEKSQIRTNGVNSSTFTANAGNDQITTAASMYGNLNDSTILGRAVTVSNSGGALPAGLSAATTYYLISVTPNTVFKLASSYANAVAGTAVDITDAGTGTHTITTIEMGVPQESCNDPTTGYSFILDDAGRVWWSTTGERWRLLAGNTLGAGNGIFANWGYLGVFRASALDFADVSSQTKIEDPVGQSIWSTPAAFQTGLVSATKHKTFIKDNVVYFGNGRYVGSIEEVENQTFNPGSGSTYTYTATDLDLLPGWTVGPLSELGNKLMVFASKSGQSRCFPWNPDETSWDGDFPVPGTEIYDVENILNTIFIASANDGCIYTTLGTVASLFLRFPSHLPGSGTNEGVRIRRIKYFKNRLFFTLDSTNASDAVSGIWSVRLDGTGLSLEHQLSNGSYGTSNTVFVPLLHKITDKVMVMGWDDNQSSTQGLDSVGISANYYTSYAAYVIFELLSVGNVKTPWTPSEIMFQLVKSLADPHGIRLSYRTSDSGSFTTIGTYDYATLGAVMSHFDEPGILNAEVLQIKAELTGSGNGGPKLKYITVS